MTLWHQLSLQILLLQILATQGEKIDQPSLIGSNVLYGTDTAQKIHDGGLDTMAEYWFMNRYSARMKIKEIYEAKYPGESLEKRFEDKANDSLDDLYSDSFWSPHSLLAKTVFEVIQGDWDEKGAIQEIICANDQEIKVEMDAYYSNTYKDKIEVVLGRFCGDNEEFKRVMVQYCWKGLCQEKRMTPEQADNEAKALRAIDPDDDSDNFKNKLYELLDKNCEPDMKQIFEKYRQGGDGIEQATEKAFKNNGDAEMAYWRLVKYIENTCSYYADELQNGVDGFGTDTDKINRIVLTRCERDLLCVLKKFEEMHGKTFTERLKTDTVAEPRYLSCIQYLCGKT